MAGLTALVIGLGRGGAKRGVAGQGNQQAVEAAFTKGHYHYKRREYAAAISHFDNAIGLMPRFARGYRMRGKTYRRLGEPDKAISDFCRAIELEPENADAFSDRALAYLDKSRTAISKSASQSYRDAFERDRKWSNELIRKQSLAPVPRNR